MSSYINWEISDVPKNDAPFTKPGPAILTWPISFAPCLLISIIKAQSDDYCHLYSSIVPSSYINWEISDVPKNDDQLDPNPEFRSVSLWIAHIEWNEMYWRNDWWIKMTIIVTLCFYRIVEMLYHSINNGGCGFLLLWFLFVRKFFGNKTGSSFCNTIHETRSCHFCWACAL
jgi:hypothetical protein